MNGYWYQSSDWDCRNAIYFDLIQYNWPVIYAQNGQALVYYVGHWLPPACLAKLVQALTGSVRWGRFMGRMFLWGWSSIGLSIIILMIFQAVGAQTKKKRIAALFLFVFFSGLDFLGGAYLQRLDYLLNPSLLHLEWWCPGYQYTSIMACLFWVFNQTIIPWMITLCFVMERDVRNYIYYCVVCLLCGTLPCIGLVILMLVKGLMYVVKTIRLRRFREVPGTVFSVQNMAAFLILFPLVASFVLTSNTAGFMTKGRQKAFGNVQVLTPKETQNKRGANYQLQPMALKTTDETSESGERISETRTMSSNAASLEESGVFSSAYFNKKLAGFFMIEVGFYLLCIFPDHRKNPLYYTLCLCFLFIPYFRVGTSHDFCMRVSVPGFFILMLYVNQFLLAHYPVMWRENHASLKDRNLKQIAAVLLMICFAVGAITPAVELYRGVYNVEKQGTIRLEDQSIMTFNRERVPDNFACSQPEDHFFFRYLAG